MILLIDNYDSFTYNLKQYIEILGYPCDVYRNDHLSLEEISRLGPKKIVVSPGPGTPDSAGITLDLIRHFSGKIPIFGVCLGHQAIGQAFGGKVIRAPLARHGKVSQIKHKKSGIFKKIRSPFSAARYHSLIVERKSLPSCLKITAETEDGLIMGLSHRDFLVEGVQFHPESVATEFGLQIIKNFLKEGEKARVK